MASMGEEYVTSIYWVEARDTAKCSVIHRTTLSILTKQYQSKMAIVPKIEEAWEEEKEGKVNL